MKTIINKVNWKTGALLLFIMASFSYSAFCQEDVTDQSIDVVWLKDGSKLRGTIIKWDIETGMDFKLATGAVIYIKKENIDKVEQEQPQEVSSRRPRYVHVPKPYAFREQGWYHNTSGFINVSFLGGAGINHAMGYRFNRLLGVGIGTGIETNDFQRVRNIIPVYAEARGFLLPSKITPYYALKLGYGIALRDELSGTIEAKGGIYMSPELGVRFGANDVSYYLGLEYKLQNATFTNDDFWRGGISTEEISYRRFELRTGLLF